MKLKELLEEAKTPDTVVYGLLKGDSGEDMTDAKETVKILKSAGFEAFIYGEDVGVTDPTGKNDDTFKDGIQNALKKKGKDYAEISESLNEADMRTMFNAIYDAALEGDEKVLKAIKLQGRLSDQNVEDAMDDVSDKDVKAIYNKYLK